MMTRKLYRIIASRQDAALRCEEHGNVEWFQRHRDMIFMLASRHMPSGGGFDTGTEFDASKSTGEKLVFRTSFHHMDEVGGYDGWTEHTVTIKPSLIHDFVITISGPDRNDIKETIHDAFSLALEAEITREEETEIMFKLGHNVPACRRG
jgi:hypothetical protein